MRHLNNHAFKGRPLAVNEARAGRACATACPAPAGRDGPAHRGGSGLRPRCGAAAPASASEAGHACRTRPEAPHLQACARPCAFQRARRGQGRGGGPRATRGTSPRRRGRARHRVAAQQRCTPRRHQGSEAEEGEKIARDLSKAGKGTRPPAKAARHSPATGGGQRAARVERAAPGRPRTGTRRYVPRATGSAGVVRYRACGSARAASYPLIRTGCV
jgi:hypothetical protein